MSVMKKSVLLKTTLLALLIGALIVVKPDREVAATAAPYMGMDTLHLFAANGSEGYTPTSSMIVINDSILYGTTWDGGTYNIGTLYKVVNSGTWWSASSTFSIVHQFGSITDDGNGCGQKLVKDNSGYIYGTCIWGGDDNAGVVYRFNTSNNTMTILYSFDGNGVDGFTPMGIVRDSASGILYGVSYEGIGTAEQGTIWKLTPSGGGYAFTLLYEFSQDWLAERPASINLGSDGNLYGTTVIGGINLAGIVWRYDLSTDTFSKIADNAYGSPHCGITQIPTSYTSGNRLEFWGTSWGGAYGLGTVYRLAETSPGSGSFNYTTMYNFNNGTDEGYYPSCALEFSPNFAAFGALYGVHRDGGVSGSGSFYRIDLSGNYSEIPSNAGQWNAGPYPKDIPWYIVEGKVGSSPAFFGSSLQGGNSNNGWLWYIYLF